LECTIAIMICTRKITKINNILIKFPMDKMYQNKKLASSDSDYTFLGIFFDYLFSGYSL